MSPLIVHTSISDQKPQKPKEERIREFNFDMFVILLHFIIYNVTYIRNHSLLLKNSFIPLKN